MNHNKLTRGGLLQDGRYGLDSNITMARDLIAGEKVVWIDMGGDKRQDLLNEDESLVFIHDLMIHHGLTRDDLWGVE